MAWKPARFLLTPSSSFPLLPAGMLPATPKPWCSPVTPHATKCAAATPSLPWPTISMFLLSACDGGIALRAIAYAPGEPWSFIVRQHARSPPCSALSPSAPKSYKPQPRTQKKPCQRPPLVNLPLLPEAKLNPAESPAVYNSSQLRLTWLSRLLL